MSANYHILILFFIQIYYRGSCLGTGASATIIWGILESFVNYKDERTKYTDTKKKVYSQKFFLLLFIQNVKKLRKLL